MGTTLLLAPHRSSAPPARRVHGEPAVATALLALGVVATGAGAGLAVRHLQEEGLSATSALGLAPRSGNSSLDCGALGDGASGTGANSVVV